MGERTRTKLILTGLLVLLAFVLSACGLVRGPARPAATLVWPANGAQLSVGQEVHIESLAIDDIGIERIELWVDNALVHSDRAPGGNDARSYGAVQTWTPTQAGRRTLTIKAYNRRGVASAPSSIIVEVLPASSAASSLATPTATPTLMPAAPTKSAATPAPCLDNATFVADITIPDETRFKPNTPFEKVWRMRNSGACTWGAGYSWIFESGDQMEAPTNISVPSALPGAEVDLKVKMKAPAEPGRYTGRWRMQAPNGQQFGQRATIVIVVLPAGLEPPAAPQQLTAVTEAPASVVLSWIDRADNETGVRIYSDDGKTLLAALKVPDITSVTLEQLPCGVELGFIVKAFNDAGESPPSPAVRVRTLPCQSNLPVIHYLRAEPERLRRGEKAILSWKLEGAREARLFPGGENGVVSPGFMEVLPSETTTYRLVATNEHGAVEMKVTVVVE